MDNDISKSLHLTLLVRFALLGAGSTLVLSLEAQHVHGPYGEPVSLS